MTIATLLGAGLAFAAMCAFPAQAVENATKCEIVDTPSPDNYTSCPGANLSTASFRDADLRWADFGGARLAGADLGGANLLGANLSDADLTGATLAGATLTQAVMSRADLTGSDLAPVLPQPTPLSAGDPIPVTWADPPAITGLTFLGCTPESGSAFAVGQTSVTCSYQAAGDPATAIAQVAVHRAGSVSGTLPPAVVNQPYRHQLTVTGFPDPYVFVETGCQLPAGLSVDRDGTVHGTPSAAGEYVITLIPSNASGGPWSAEARVAEFALTVTGPAAANVPSPTASAPSSAPVAARTGQLSDTGTHSALIAGAGVTLIAIGTGMLMIGRRRHSIG